MVDVVEQAAHDWWGLDDLVKGDPTVTGVEFGRFGASYYHCTIRRNVHVHVLKGYGSSAAEALREARRLYLEEE